MKRSFFVFGVGVLFAVLLSGAKPAWSWWPEQKTARQLVVLKRAALNRKDFKAEFVLAQSLSGLAAQGVNEGRFDELVWVDLGGRLSYDEWLRRWLAQSDAKVRDEARVWDLVVRYANAGLVKGYILYSGESFQWDGKLKRDCSLNVATTAAGILQGILVTPELEEKAKAAGLALLLDAREKSEEWAVGEFGTRVSRNLLLLQSPKNENARDLAIAQRAAAVNTLKSPLTDLMARMEPVSVVYGWYSGDEGEAVSVVSKAGHVLVAADFCLNLPVLSAGARDKVPSRLRTPVLAGAELEKKAGRACAAFMLSDGDNLQWLMGGFTHNGRFWAGAARDKVPFAWTVCPGDLAAMAPVAWDYVVETLPARASLVAHGGYFYPDLFAKNFSAEKRRELLTKLARRIGGMLEATGVRALTFLCMDVRSEDALEAYGIFAAELPEVAGVFPIQYAPYEGGFGEVFWVADGRGGEVPFATARYSIWSDVSRRTRPLAGTPDQVAAFIKEDAAKSGAGFGEWVIVHAWSGFDPARAAGRDERIANYRGKDAAFGAATAVMSAERLGKGVEVVNADELGWILRKRRADKTTGRR